MSSHILTTGPAINHWEDTPKCSLTAWYWIPVNSRNRQDMHAETNWHTIKKMVKKFLCAFPYYLVMVHVTFCRSQTLSVQGLIAFSISARAERVWWLECQNLNWHLPVVWWVLKYFERGVECHHCQSAVLLLMSKVMIHLVKHEKPMKFCCTVTDVSHGARQIQQDCLAGHVFHTWLGYIKTRCHQ